MGFRDNKLCVKFGPSPESQVDVSLWETVPTKPIKLVPSS